MSVKIFFCKCDEPWDEARVSVALAKLPAGIREKIARYKDPADRQSRIQGKLLLMKMIEDFRLDLSLDNLEYTEFNKPYLGRDFDFSISHCENLVVCAGALCAKIGIDIEPVREIDINDYRQELTTGEWYLINHSKDASRAFLQTWTKKEALLKATGRGIDMDMSYIDVSNNVITVHKEHFSLFPVTYDESFVAHIALCIDYNKMRAANVRFEMTTEAFDDIK
ncbi:MAG: 4-phosphopantetheinyl transferase superfamily protein [Bacteroidetes bacterium]|nr:4-phosphopantetheinyl transferase superfamily protein [Bacteroidota bacterium]